MPLGEVARQAGVVENRLEYFSGTFTGSVSIL